MSFFEIFQPGLKHLREERDRQKTLVANPTHGGGAPLGIDLDGGTATFKMPATPEVPDIAPNKGAVNEGPAVNTDQAATAEDPGERERPA